MLIVSLDQYISAGRGLCFDLNRYGRRCGRRARPPGPGGQFGHRRPGRRTAAARCRRWSKQCGSRGRRGIATMVVAMSLGAAPRRLPRWPPCPRRLDPAVEQDIERVARLADRERRPCSGGDGRVRRRAGSRPGRTTATCVRRAGRTACSGWNQWSHVCRRRRCAAPAPRAKIRASRCVQRRHRGSFYRERPPALIAFVTILFRENLVTSW